MMLLPKTQHSHIYKNSDGCDVIKDTAFLQYQQKYDGYYQRSSTLRIPIEIL